MNRPIFTMLLPSLALWAVIIGIITAPITTAWIAAWIGWAAMLGASGRVLFVGLRRALA